MSDYPNEYERALHYSNSSRVTEADFHKSIHENPEEDLNSLAYADWLEENGRPAHAEFLRTQIHNPNNPDPVPHIRHYSVFPTLNPGESELRLYHSGVDRERIVPPPKWQFELVTQISPDHAIRWNHFDTEPRSQKEVGEFVRRLLSEGVKASPSVHYQFPEIAKEYNSA